MPDRTRSDLIGTTSDVLTSSARRGKKEKKNWFARHVRSVSCLLINQSVISFIICMHRIGLSRRVASWLTSMMHADAPYRHASILSRDITHIYIRCNRNKYKRAPVARRRFRFHSTQTTFLARKSIACNSQSSVSLRQITRSCLPSRGKSTLIE